LFVWAESVYLPQLFAVAAQFRAAGIVRDADLRPYDALVMSTRRLIETPWTSLVIISLAYAWTLVFSRVVYPSEFASWVVSAETGQLTFAGWWRTLVSQPLFLTLLFTALWRIAVWIRFLRAVTTFDLQLVADHPDRRCGLGFALIPLRGFTILAIAFGAIAAGDVVSRVLIDGESVSAFGYLIAAQVLGLVVLLAGPFFLFAVPVSQAQARGGVEYGAADFLIVDVRSIALLAFAALLPYVPVVVAVVPIRRLVDLALRVVT
jgi:hypothetical protein